MNTVRNTLFGGLLLVVACIMLFWAEGRAVHEAQALAEGAGIVMPVAADAVDPANDGKLVHVSGVIVPQDTPSDVKLGISAPKTVRLMRRVEMFQWQEVTRSEEKTGADGKTVKTDVTDYRQVWSEKPIDSATFKMASAPQNPPMSVTNESFDVGEGKIGAFRLAGNEFAGLGKTDPLLLREEDRAAVAAAMGSSRRVTLSANVLTVAFDPMKPRVGDLRITYFSGLLDKVSVVAAQRGDELVPFTASNGNSIFLVEQGLLPAVQMFRNAEAGNVALTWGLRLIGLVLMFAGAKLTLSFFSALGSVIPLVGGLLRLGTTLVAAAVAVALSTLMIGLGWLFYRPLIGIAIIVVGGALAYGTGLLARRAGPAAPQSAKA